MREMVNNSFEDLKRTGKLPTLPGVGMRLLRMTNDENCSLKELAATVELDPALTGRILEVANSAASGSAHRITTVHDAAVRLGMRAVRNVALGFSLLAENRSGNCEGFDFEIFWADSMARAIAAQVLSKRFKVGDAAEAFVCGLLSRIGELALVTVHPKIYADILRDPRAGNPPGRSQLEREQFGITQAEVAASLTLEWGLPETFAQAIESLDTVYDSPLDEPEESVRPGLPELLQVAVEIASGYTTVRDRPRNTAIVERNFTALGCDHDEEDFADLWDEIAQEWERWGKFLKVRTFSVPKYKQGSEIAGPVEPVEAASQKSVRGCRVLAVDDDRLSLRVIQRHLTESGHEVMTAADGEQALEVALKHNPEIIVADWHMPGLDGLELCNALRRFDQGCSMYFLLLTGQGDLDGTVRAFEEGVDDYVTKPVHPRLLQARVLAGQRMVRLRQRVEQDKKTMQSQVAELAVLTRKLRQASLTDALTGLPNRRFGMETLQRNWQKAVDAGETFSVIMSDIDHFKKVNDTHGHDAGDAVLCEVSRILGATSRHNDVVARMGGEEFLLILPGTSIDDAARVGDRVRRAIGATEVDTGDGQMLGVTMSFGVAEFHGRLRDHHELIKAADLALYQAKDGGRNRVCLMRQRAPQPLSPS